MEEGGGCGEREREGWGRSEPKSHRTLFPSTSTSASATTSTSFYFVRNPPRTGFHACSTDDVGSSPRLLSIVPCLRPPFSLFQWSKWKYHLPLYSHQAVRTECPRTGSRGKRPMKASAGRCHGRLSGCGHLTARGQTARRVGLAICVTRSRVKHGSNQSRRLENWL